MIMTPHIRKPRNQKPHKRIIEKMKEDYFAARNEAKRRQLTKEQEVELCYLQDEIDRRWFRFFADHYLPDTLKQYSNIIYTAPRR